MFGSPKVSSGYNYWGGICQAVCLGPVARLHTIKNGDTVIWEGPLESSSADANGKSTLSTSLGTIHFYWGTADQDQDPLLQAALLELGAGPTTVPIPAWPHLCYAVGADISFGTQQSPPVLSFELELESSGLSLSVHQIDSDGVIPEILYGWLTNTVWGRGLDSGLIDQASFEAAAETVIAEGLGVSPTIDATQSLREIMGQLLQYIDGVLYFESGKLHLRLIRAESTAGLETIDEGELLDEPRPVNEGPSETWNVTAVSFTDRENQYEISSETYDDPANAALLQESKLREVSLPFIKTRAVAKKVAKLIGVRGGLVPMSWRLELKPSWSGLVPGDRVFVTFAKLGISSRLVRVTEIDRGTPEDPAVRVTVMEENTRDTSHDYVPRADTFTVKSFFDGDGQDLETITSTEPRLSWVPEALKGGKADGFLVVCRRPDALTQSVRAFWTWDPAHMSYLQVASSTSFPAKGTLICWHRIREDHWLLRVRFNAHDYERMTNLLALPDIYAVAGHRLVKLVGATQDQHQLMAGWAALVQSGYSDLLTADTIDLEVVGGEFGTSDFALETTADPARVPAQHIYFGRQQDFLIYCSDQMQFESSAPNAPGMPPLYTSLDEDLIRYVKTPVTKRSVVQSVNDVTETTFDRDDTTMHPDGTLSRTWGDRVPSTYELFDIAGADHMDGVSDEQYQDIEDIDEALGAILDGTATDVQTLIAADIDTVLGAMVESSAMVYNGDP